MNMIKICLTAVAVMVVFLVFGCGGKAGSDAPGDSITINSITPSLVSAGTMTTFTISVSCNLQTKDSGVINYALKTGSSYSLESENKIVSKGTGTASFAVIKTLNETHTVRVLLSEYPHDPQWSPLASTEQTITVVVN